jgi:hypothetical protein
MYFGTNANEKKDKLSNYIASYREYFWKKRYYHILQNKSTALKMRNTLAITVVSIIGKNIFDDRKITHNYSKLSISGLINAAIPMITA